MVLLVTERAKRDSRAIIRYYKRETGSADWFISKLHASTAHLLLWPYSGSERVDITADPVRLWLMKPYYLVYRAERDAMSLPAILHTSRDLARALKGPR